MSTAHIPLSEKQLEDLIVDRGLVAPRLSPDHIDAQIMSETYHHFPGTTLTVAVLILRNGQTVTGESACVSPENFDHDIGRKIARHNAREKIWGLEGYLLSEKLHTATPNAFSELPNVVLDLQGTWDQYPPHQRRVLEEEHELAGRIGKLIGFFDTDIFAELDIGEQKRMYTQAYVMKQYQNVLRARINAFPKPADLGTEGA